MSSTRPARLRPRRRGAAPRLILVRSPTPGSSSSGASASRRPGRGSRRRRRCRRSQRWGWPRRRSCRARSARRPALAGRPRPGQARSAGRAAVRPTGRHRSRRRTTWLGLGLRLEEPAAGRRGRACTRARRGGRWPGSAGSATRSRARSSTPRGSTGGRRGLTRSAQQQVGCSSTGNGRVTSSRSEPTTRPTSSYAVDELQDRRPTARRGPATQ